MHPIAFAAFGGDCELDPISFHATSWSICVRQVIQSIGKQALHWKTTSDSFFRANSIFMACSTQKFRKINGAHFTANEWKLVNKKFQMSSLCRPDLVQQISNKTDFRTKECWKKVFGWKWRDSCIANVDTCDMCSGFSFSFPTATLFDQFYSSTILKLEKLRDVFLIIIFVWKSQLDQNSSQKTPCAAWMAQNYETYYNYYNSNVGTFSMKI